MKKVTFLNLSIHKGEVMFFNTDFLKSEEIYLKLEKVTEENHEKNYVPAYHFKICTLNGEEIGECDLRIGYNENTYYGGNIGYSIKEEYRGNHFAGKASLLLFELAKRHNMEYLIITCDPENLASRKTCEYIGCEFTEIVKLPENSEEYILGEREKCVYRINFK